MKPFKCEDCIECCANAYVTAKEMVKIRRYLRQQPTEDLQRLKDQERKPGVCPFADIENKRCTVYEVRPWVCRKFGFVERMQCSYNKHIPLSNFGEALEGYILDQGVDQIMDDELILGRTITWDHGIMEIKGGH